MTRYLYLICSCFFLLFMLPLKADEALLQQLILAAKPQFLPADQAFVVTTQQTDNQLQIILQPAEGYYLYREKIRVDVAGAESAPLSLPAGVLHEDEFLGKTEIYPQTVSTTLSFPAIAAGAKVTLYYQGCTTGLCYPPQQTTIALQAFRPALTQSEPVVPAAPDSTDTTALLQPGLLALLSFFAMGVGLSLTPCVYPMYPVLSAMLSQHGNTLNWQRGFTLSFVYVLGMALTYTVIGVFIASAGAGIQGWLQNPWLLGIFSLFYLLLALSLMFGNGIQLPRALQDKLQGLANQQSLHSLRGVAMLGALSGLIGSPCTSAPLSGVLLFIAQSGNPLYGALTLFLLSLGMGLPLLLMGIFGGKVLPRAGAWMVFIKQLFAVLLLAMPLFLLERLLPAHIATLLWSCFVLAVVLWLIWRLWPVTKAPGLKTVTLLLLLSGGIFAATQYEWQPADALPFTAVNNSEELQQQLAAARAQGKPVMLDLYADWCTACRELDDKTFSDPQVQHSLSDYQLLRADVSANNAEHRALMQELQVLGLPNVLFFDKQSKPSPHLRIQGFIPADELQGKLEQCQHSQLC